ARLIGALALGLALLVTANPSAADDGAPVPTFLKNKHPLPDSDEKTEGGYVTGLPLLAYDTNTKVGLGVGGYFTQNGPRSDVFYAYTPYRFRVFLQIFATTGGYQQHQLSLDDLYIGDSPYRLRAMLTFERNTNANYFGIGEATLDP